MFSKLRHVASERLEVYLDAGPPNVSFEMALAMRRARGFSLIGQLILLLSALMAIFVLPSLRFFCISVLTMLVSAGAVRFGAIADGRYFRAMTHTTIGVMLAGTIATSVSLGYASPFGVTFSVLIIMAANYILGVKASIFWTSASILGVSYAVLTSAPIPFPPEAMQPSLATTLGSRVVVLIGVCAISVAERQFSDRQSRDLETLATYDSLTGLLNRRGFRHRLRDSVARARRHDRRVGLIFFDVDEFKQINDEHGHAFGDGLLRRIGQQLASMTRKGDAAGRAGGDEFVMLLEDVGESKDVEIFADRVLIRLRCPIDASGDHSAELSVSIGAACYPDDADDVESLLHAADLAMYRAKASGGSAVRKAH